ncbi:MAG: glutamyl-tRNA reductase [Planctomycetota bacterium]
MNLRMIGCTHQSTGLDVRQRLAFDGTQTTKALETWQHRFDGAEFVLLSTCNRVELYAASNGHPTSPTSDQLIDELLEFHSISREQVEGQLLTLTDHDVVSHLYRVAASLESMVVGEPQILSQVKQAYQSAQDIGATGPMLHELFQSALHTAKRVSGETQLHKHRVSIPSVAISELASCVFETFDDKHVLVIGAGEMAEETLRYLHDAGTPQIHVVNRSQEHGQQLAEKWDGTYHAWDQLWTQLSLADLAISTTAATEPLVTAADFEARVVPHRHQRPLFVMDLSVPLDFEPSVGEALGVYLYSIDDLDLACQRNRAARAAEFPTAEKIVLQETERFASEQHRRETAPVITSLRAELEKPKAAELKRLFNKLPDLDEQTQQEIERFADRLVNKMLHPPLESLRDASQNGTPYGLLDAVRRLFRIED